MATVVIIAVVTSLAGSNSLAATPVLGAPDWTVPLFGGLPVATADGNVLATGDGDSNTITSPLQKLNPTGGRLWHLPPNSADRPVTGFPTMTDAAGNTYFGQSDGSLAAIDSAGNRRWRTAGLGISCCGLLALGWDGNIYVSGFGGSQVLGFSQATGAQTLDLRLSDPTGLYAYQGGLIVVRSSSVVTYYSYQGSLLAGPFAGGSAVDLHRAYGSASGGGGVVFLAGYSSGVSGFVPGVVKITPAGLAWTWSGGVTAGHQLNVAATPDGGVVLAGVDDSFVSIGPSGVARWTYAPTQLARRFVASFLPVVDTGGRVALPHNYEFSTDAWPRNTGVQVDFASQSSASPALPPLSVEGDHCPAGEGGRGTSLNGTTGLGSGPADIGPGRLYLGLSDFCTGFTKSESVQGFSVPGLGANYRLSLVTPPLPSGPAPTTTTTTTAPPSAKVSVSPTEGRPGATFTFTYTCAAAATPRLVIYDDATAAPALGVAVGLPATGNGQNYTQSVTPTLVGSYTGKVTCNGTPAGSAGFIVSIASDVPPAGSGAPYVALGDSYSSGEGLGPFMFPTDEACAGLTGTVQCKVRRLTYGNLCHRSQQAYPWLVLSGDRIREDRAFRACSGAVLDDVYHVRGFERIADADDGKSFDTEKAQLAWLGPNTRYVTMSLSGNDVGFEHIIKACIYKPGPLQDRKSLRPDQAFHDSCAAAIDGGFRQLNSLKSKLAALYALLAQRAPHAQIRILNYPILFPDPDTYTGFKNQACQITRLKRWYVLDEHVRRFRELNKALNTVIGNSIPAGGNVQLVDIAERFAGRSVSCGDSGAEPWINQGLAQVGTERESNASFHPNRTGQCHMARAVNSSFGWNDPTLRC